jgi:hypothetical protein
MGKSEKQIRAREGQTPSWYECRRPQEIVGLNEGPLGDKEKTWVVSAIVDPGRY